MVGFPDDGMDPTRDDVRFEAHSNGESADFTRQGGMSSPADRKKANARDSAFARTPRDQSMTSIPFSSGVHVGPDVAALNKLQRLRYGSARSAIIITKAWI